jgi:hypothetical protein
LKVEGDIGHIKTSQGSAPVQRNAQRPLKVRQSQLRIRARNSGSRAGPTYPDKPIRYRIAKNVPTLTKVVTPTENRILASSTCLVLR